MKKGVFALAAAAVLGTTAGAAAQSLGVSVEGRVDMAVPTGDFGENVGPAPMMSVSGTLWIFPTVGFYGSYGRAVIQVDDSDTDFTDEGFSTGLAVAFPEWAGTRLSPWLTAGVLFHHIDFDAGGDLDSDVGFEVMAGLAVPLVRRVQLTPAVGYRSYATDSDAAGFGQTDVTYLTAGVGLSISF